jgi:hypothetical protein
MQVAGAVTVMPAAGGAAKPVKLGDTIASDDTVVTGADGVVDVKLAQNAALLHLGGGQSVRLDASVAWELPQQIGGSDAVATDPSVNGNSAAGRPAENSAARATLGAVPMAPGAAPAPTPTAAAAPVTESPAAEPPPPPSAMNRATSTPTTPTVAPPPPPPPPPVQPSVQPQSSRPARIASPAPKHAGPPPAPAAQPASLRDTDGIGSVTVGPSGDSGGGASVSGHTRGGGALPASADLVATIKACYPAGTAKTLVIVVDAQGRASVVKSVSAAQSTCTRAAIAAAGLSLSAGSYTLVLR